MFQEADMGITELAHQFGSDMNNARFLGDKHLWVQFSMEPMPDPEASQKEGRPIYKEVPHIKIMQPGNKESIVVRPITEMDKARFRQQYENWIAGNKEVLEGMPLEKWPRITRAQVEELKHFNVRTVEQLAGMSDANAQQFMGIATLRQWAREDVARGKEGALSGQMVQALKAKDDQIAALTEALEDLKKKVTVLEGGGKAA